MRQFYDITTKLKDTLEANSQVNVVTTGDIYVGDDAVIKDDLSCDNISCNDIQSKNANVTTKVTANNLESGNALFSCNSSNTAVEIRQLGIGDCLRIEDNTNPDSTPLIVDNNGNLGLGVIPTNKLDVIGNVVVTGDLSIKDNAANDLFRIAHSNGASNEVYIQVGETASDTDSRIYFTRMSSTNNIADMRLYTDKVRILGNVNFGDTIADNSSSAKVQINSTTQGFLMPRLTSTQMNAVTSPVDGLMIYNTTLATPFIYSVASWLPLSVQPNSWIRFALTANQNTQGAITFNNNTIYGSPVDFSYTGSTLTINTTGYYKVEGCCTFINTAAEKEIYLNFSQLTPSVSTLCFSIGSSGIEDSGTTYNNVSISDMLLLSAGRTYNFSYSSQTGTSSDLYSSSKALITRVT